MEKSTETSPNNSTSKNEPKKKNVYLKILVMALGLLLVLKLCFGESATIGIYTKEELPENFAYKILKDESDAVVEKNHLQVELNQKLTIGQIATLAEDLFETKDEQRRFYISYKLKDVENSSINWANSDFDPELKIQINGSTNKEDDSMLLEAKKVSGDIVGIFNEQEYTFAYYIIYKSNNKTLIKTMAKNGDKSEVELNESKVENGIRYNYKNGGYNGEYFILNNKNILEFYNKENKRFTFCPSVK